MTAVYFGPGGRRIVGDHRVQLRQLWNQEWVTYVELHCTEVVWAAAPIMPTATLVWNYGVVKSHISNAYAAEAKLDVGRWYIKITFVTDVPSGETVTWYGVVSDVEDQQSGFARGMEYPSGQQVLHCFGMEQLLNQSVISSSWIYHGIENLHESPLPITFNDRGIGNRTVVQHPPVESHVFDGTPMRHLGILGEPISWTTRDIVRYLLFKKSPSRSAETRIVAVPFDVLHEARLDSSDSPILHQEGATPLSLLYRLIDRRRMTSFRIIVDETVSPAVVKLDPFTFTADGIDFDLPDVMNIPQNMEIKTLLFERDEMTTAAVRTVDLQRVDRVIVRGARRTSTCTLFEAADLFEGEWTAAEESVYEAGASGEDDYAEWDTLKKLTRNQEVRTHEALRSVYSWFGIPENWDLTVGLTESDFRFPVFEDERCSAHDQYIHGITILPYLPLLERVDYSGDKILRGLDLPSTKVYRRPSLIFKRPTDGRYVSGEKIGQLVEGETDPVGSGNNPRWSAHARVQPDSRVVEIHVSGEPQHVIAGTDFESLDDDRDVGEYDYIDKKMLVTVALQECRYAEGSYPGPPLADHSLIDAQRALVLWAGDGYRQDYVVCGTVVDVDDDGTLKQVSTPGYVRDDTLRLGVIARIAWEWYHYDRCVLTLATNRLTANVVIGDIITEIGDTTIPDNTHWQYIDSAVTQIRIRNPRITPGSESEPTMSIVTSAGELDAMTLVPPPPRRGARGRRRGGT